MYFTSKRIDIPYELLYDLYVNQRLSIRQCAKKIGHSHEVVWNAMKREKISRRAKVRIPNEILTPEWLHEMYVVRKLSLKQCGVLAECSSKTVLNALRRNGIQSRPFQTPPTGATKEWLTEYYVRKQLSMQRCADILGCDVESIRTALQRHNITARPYIRDGPNNHQWRGGVSYLPYCPKWTEELREATRDDFGRRCFICSMTEAENGRKLSVHHINFDKMAGCYGRRWNLIPLCNKCHNWTSNHRFESFNLLMNHWAMEYIQDDSAFDLSGACQ